MRVDYEYLNNFLSLALDNGKSDFKLNSAPFQKLWPKGDEQALDKLVFHLEILSDQNCLESALTKKDNLGFKRTGSGWIVNDIPLRLTAHGHQFAADLTKPTVIEQLRTSFSDAGPNEVVKIAFALSKNVIEKKLKQLTEH